MMERYSEYKDSGVKWLGEIPSHWEVQRLGSFFSERKEKVSDQDYAPLSVTKQGIFPQLENVAKTNDGDNRKLVKEGDFVINSRSDRKGSSGVSELDGSVSLINLVLQPRKTIFGPFCNYLLKSYGFIEENYRNGRGIVADLWTTRYNEMKMIKVAMPSLEEQKTISSYLDTATSEIDKAIAMQQKMIDLLNERKQIIIQNAVTKGLDENVEMKESGVESIGRIPIGWKIKKLKYVMRSFGRIGFRGYGTKDIVDEGQGAITLSPSNIQESSMDYSKRTYLSWNKYYESPEIMIENGDVLMVKTGSSYGKCAIVKNMPMECTINPQLVVFKEHTEMPEYLAYCFQTSFAKFFINTSVIGGTIPTISQEKINNYVFPFPMKSEQQQIVTYLDSEMQRFDSAITNCQRQITLLQERKQIIINEVVTGKVRVS